MSHKKGNKGKSAEKRYARRIGPGKRDWSGVTSKPIIAEAEVPLDIKTANKDEIARAFAMGGDGIVIGSGDIGVGDITWQATASLPVPDVDAGLDGSF